MMNLNITEFVNVVMNLRVECKIYKDSIVNMFKIIGLLLWSFIVLGRTLYSDSSSKLGHLSHLSANSGMTAFLHSYPASKNMIILACHAT
jgi:hypothetical protein